MTWKGTEITTFTNTKNNPMKNLLILFIGLLSYYNTSAQKYTDIYIKDANIIGLEWWSQINTEQYEKAYKNLSDVLTSSTSLKDWTSQISILMNEFGNVESRIVTDTYFQSELEGLEDGFYVIIKYDVKYSKTINHSESLLLKQNDKLDWEILDFNYSFQDLEELK